MFKDRKLGMLKMANFFNDIASEKDYLGYYPYIEAFNYILVNNNKLITPPLVFGIHGKWGSGKTTFMNLIRSRIQKEKKFYTIEINPWEYGQSQNFITIFLAKLYKEVKGKIKRPNSKEALDFIKSIFKPLKLSLDIKPVKAEYDFDKFSFDQQQNVIDKFVSENFALKESISYILNHQFIDNKKIVIFIDDLDRCDVEKVMEVIESIKLIFNSKNCIFFLGCDINYLQSALSNKYKDFIEFSRGNNNVASFDLNDFSREYLEKIIQIPFYIPPIDGKAIKKYVNSIIDHEKVSNNKIDLNENVFEKFKKDLEDEFVSELIIATDINPRRIKRILNLTFLNYVFMKFKNVEKNKLIINTKLLTFLCVLREVYPKFYRERLSRVSLCRKTFESFFEKYDSEKISYNKDAVDLAKEWQSIKYNNELIKAGNMNDLTQHFKGKSAEENEILEEKIYSLFELYFKNRDIKDIKELNDEIYYIDLYISVSNLNVLEGDEKSEWGNLAQIKSDITGKKLVVFLQMLTDNVPAKNLIYWFFNDIYLSNMDNYVLGIVKNINVYLRMGEGRRWIFKFDFDKEDNILDIIFDWKSEYKTPVKDLNQILTSNKYNHTNKKILVDEETTSNELEKIKDNIISLIKKSSEVINEVSDEVAAGNDEKGK